MNWYLAQLTFAQPTDDPSASVLCESCYVLFEADSANSAYDKAVEWAEIHESESTFDFVGVRHLNSLDEPPADGVEVGGGFYEETAVWLRRVELIPARDEIPVIVFEGNPDTPIGKLINTETASRVRKLFSTDDEPSGPLI
jgi:hypothetical protein